MSAFTLPWLTSASRPQGNRGRILIFALAVVALVGTDLLWAASRGGGGGSSAGSRGSHGGGGHRHSGGHHHHHGSHSHWGWGLGFGFGWPWWGYPSYSYPWPYYYDYAPAPAYYPPQTYYVPPPQTVQSSESDGYWYYCRASKTFYPYVKECSDGQWERVDPRAPPPGPDNVRSYSSP